nr:unnamed protein product [Digitaria exilis]
MNGEKEERRYLEDLAGGLQPLEDLAGGLQPRGWGHRGGLQPRARMVGAPCRPAAASKPARSLERQRLPGGRAEAGLAGGAGTVAPAGPGSAAPDDCRRTADGDDGARRETEREGNERKRDN